MIIVRDVSIIGIGQTKVGEHWDRSLRDLAVEALLAAMDDAGVEEADALYVGNMLSGEISGQEHLGALVADYASLRGIEAVKVEAACGSAAAALRLGYLAVAGGLHDVVLVCGVEKMTDRSSDCTTAYLATGADGDYEAAQGLSFVAMNALLMRRYMYEYDVRHEDFGYFSVNAHANAMGNEYAMFPHPISLEDYGRARMVADPINLLDSAPMADGAAAVVLCANPRGRSYNGRALHVVASASATDTISLHDRRAPLFLEGAQLSANRAYHQAGVTPSDIDLFELHDAFSIMAALSLEACGFAERGRGVRLAQEGETTLEGRIPICTLGGLKGRGHPVGATGLYQIAEVGYQLRGEAGRNQVDCRLGMAQNIGGSGATVITHILEACE
ncbi:MAG: thiolase domain-containing protein [Anaerolineae bacterium]